MGYDEGRGESPTPKFGYDFHKCSTFKVLANPQERRLNQAKAGEGGSVVGLRAVDVQRTWQLKRRVAVAVRVFPSIGFCVRIPTKSPSDSDLIAPMDSEIYSPMV
jgi:hypothetical protein